MATSRPYHHGNLREALVAGGVDLARTGGPAAVVLRAVSRRAGVSHNAAYRHFAGHEALLAAVAASCMNRLGRLMLARSAAVDLPDEVAAARARLDAIGRAYIDFALTEPGWFRTAFCGTSAAPRGEPDPASGLASGGEPGPEGSCGADPYAILSTHLDDLVRLGAFPPDRRPGAEYAAWSAVHGLSDLLVEGPLRGLSGAELRTAVEAVLSTVARGL
ncbi:TetR/AcrR family transcriptional regulator [Kitasatospora sp. NPDC059088]|uniref:TetR/AcrR family transcriptional regulator n=1 Tax=Kitasatospora sp. NPDC059088 TaxID=3346722 RepID=UPI00368B381B